MWIQSREKCDMLCECQGKSDEFRILLDVVMESSEFEAIFELDFER